MIQKRKSFTAFIAFACLLTFCSSAVLSQSGRSGVSEEVFVVNYLANKKFKIQFLAKPAFQSATGTGEIELDQKGVATIRTEFKGMKSVFTIGGRYSTYVIWAVLDDGSAQPLGELTHNARPLESDGQFNTEVTLTGNFGLLVSAEPHGLVTVPSTVVLVAGPPIGDKGTLAKSKKVQCFLSDVDHSGAKYTGKKKEEEKYRRQEPMVFGAEYAIQMAIEAGAETYATDEINEATNANEALKSIANSGREEQIEQAARRTIGFASDAEKKAILRKRLAREEQTKLQMSTRIGSLQDNLDAAIKEVARLRSDFEKVSAELAVVRENFSEKRIQSDRLQIENDRLTFEREKEKQETTSLRTRIQLLESEIDRFKGPKEFAADRADLEDLLRNFGKVQSLTDGLGLELTLADTFWMATDSDVIANEKLAEIEMLAREIGSRRYLSVEVVSYVTDKEDIVAGDSFAKRRAKSLEALLGKSGIPNERLRSRGISTYQPPPVKSTKKEPVRANRVEILLKVL